MKQPIFLQAVTFLAAGLLSFTVEAADFVEGYQEATPDAGITVWEIPDSLLARDFSLFVTIIDTDFKPEPEAKFGYPGDRFGPMILNFERDGDDLVLLQKTASDICGQAKGPSASLYVMQSNMELARFPIAAEKGGSFKIDVSDWLSDDSFFGLQRFAFLLRIGQEVSEDRISRVRDIEYRPGQIMVRSDLQYSSLPFPGVPQDTTNWSVGTCLTVLPEKKMEPVLADRRVGYFTVPAAKTDSSGYFLEKTSYIRKFRDGVTFCLYPGIPARLVPSIRKSIGVWDDIFKENGLEGYVSLSNLHSLK